MISKLLPGLLIGGALMLPAPFASSQISGQDALLRIRQLENEVTRLQREIDAQSRRIEELERNLRATSGATLSPPPPDIVKPSTDGSPGWLVSTNWDHLKRGMKDLDVIALLGRPTSVRTEPDGKSHALLYAIELGPSAVLAGNVRFNESGVSEINRPTVR